jgi:hypothetical protein
VFILFLKFLFLSCRLIRIIGTIGKRERWENKILAFFCLLQVTGKLTALKGLDARLKEIRSYLDLVIDEKIPLNHEILYHLQVHF